MKCKGLLQYCQLPDKNFRDISSDIWNFLAVFKRSSLFIPLLCAEPVTMFCGTVLGKLLHTVRQVLAEEEPEENIGDISKKVCHNFPSKWALSVQSPQNLTKLLHL